MLGGREAGLSALVPAPCESMVKHSLVSWMLGILLSSRMAGWSQGSC